MKGMFELQLIELSKMSLFSKFICERGKTVLPE